MSPKTQKQMNIFGLPVPVPESKFFCLFVFTFSLSWNLSYVIDPNTNNLKMAKYH